MSDLFSRAAVQAYKNGNYQKALDIYKQLAILLGAKNFDINIKMCEAKLRSELRRDCMRLPLKELKVACVMDEFTFHSYQPECELFQLSPDHALNELEDFQPDFLFIESAWRGKNDKWDRKIGTLSNELKLVLSWCKSCAVPTVFWNKEDPVHFETFLTTAKQFDYVFTTDIDCIARYKSALGHNNVYLLPFGCQPKQHNPIELYDRKDAFCFAGAYYVRYPDRTKDLEAYVSEFPTYKPLEIFDRNFGKEDANYKFPDEYQPYIVGTLPFNEIDKAYKGYRYSINLNSIKQSQTMFARRVYELLGSNTITVSNFSRGVRLVFGDLVICSDNGSEVVNRLKELDAESEQKLRLAGLRKVMLEHTYMHRLAYLANKTLNWKLETQVASIAVISIVESDQDLDRILESFSNQKYIRKNLIIILNGSNFSKTSSYLKLTDVNILTISDANKLNFSHFDKCADWFSVMSPNDYYGPNYLIDLAVATTYSDHFIVGKKMFYQAVDNVIELNDTNGTYRVENNFSLSSSIISKELVNFNVSILSWVNLVNDSFSEFDGLSIDQFNYCKNAHRSDVYIESIKEKVDDIILDSGIPINDLLAVAEKIQASELDESSVPKWSSRRLYDLFSTLTHQKITFASDNENFFISSDLDDTKHEYFYNKNLISTSEMPSSNGDIESYLDVTPGLDIQYVFVFFNEQKVRLNHVIHTSNRNQISKIPGDAKYFRLGFRIRGCGFCEVKSLFWSNKKLEASYLLGKSDTLLLTNHYPSYDDLYRNGFVHSRVKSYNKEKVHIDVFRIRQGQTVSYHEFQNVDIITGSEIALEKILNTGRYSRILIHFLLPEMWDVLCKFPNLECITWVHGSEIQPWHRRDYNYTSEKEREKAIIESDIRMNFWRGILNPMPKNLKLVFVSRYFAEEVFEDLGFRVPENNYTIIHNPIDTDLFSYIPKSLEQRKNILSIRPYASRKYANDLSVNAILKLSKEPFFHDLHFRMIGDGVLFDEILEPLRGFSNVIIERRFLSHSEIAELHKNYGICLTPTRMDAQGVSRDEAMSSGLVPITNAVAAIPEFVNSDCGFLAESEDSDGLAYGIAMIYKDPNLFSKLSNAAALRVRSQCSSALLISKEINLIKG